MGLSHEDLKKVPERFTRKDCYRRIYEWYREIGQQKRMERFQSKGIHNDKTRLDLLLLEKLPRPDEISEECMDFIFDEVISGWMEWAYHEIDKYGIKMAAYARFAINQKYKEKDGRRFGESIKSCPLYKIFHELK